jgi:hypothetical protein
MKMRHVDRLLLSDSSHPSHLARFMLVGFILGIVLFALSAQVWGQDTRMGDLRLKTGTEQNYNDNMSVIANWADRLSFADEVIRPTYWQWLDGYLPLALHHHGIIYCRDCVAGSVPCAQGTEAADGAWARARAPLFDEWECATMNGTGGGGGGDITDVWTCSSGDCSDLTATTGDILNATGADTTAPCKLGIIVPPTCTQGQCFQELESERELCWCVATNTWECWDANGGTVTQIDTGYGLTGGPITTVGIISVLIQNGPCTGDDKLTAEVDGLYCRSDEIGGGGGGGDITDVWTCSSGDCSDLTATTGDKLNATGADTTAPCKTGTTLPATCTEGQCFQDTNALDEVCWCTATNVWTCFADGDTVNQLVNASFITRVPEVELNNETALSLLATGLLKNTTTTGIPTIYAGTTCAGQAIQTLDASGAATACISAGGIIGETFGMCITIQGVIAADDSVEFWGATRASRLISVSCHCDSGCTTKPRLTFIDRVGNPIDLAAPAYAECETGTADSTFRLFDTGDTDRDLALGEGVQLNVTNTPAAPEKVMICLRFSILS